MYIWAAIGSRDPVGAQKTKEANVDAPKTKEAAVDAQTEKTNEATVDAPKTKEATVDASKTKEATNDQQAKVETKGKSKVCCLMTNYWADNLRLTTSLSVESIQKVVQSMLMHSIGYMLYSMFTNLIDIPLWKGFDSPTAGEQSYSRCCEELHSQPVSHV